MASLKIETLLERVAELELLLLSGLLMLLFAIDWGWKRGEKGLACQKQKFQNFNFQFENEEKFEIVSNYSTSSCSTYCPKSSRKVELTSALNFCSHAVGGTSSNSQRSQYYLFRKHHRALTQTARQLLPSIYWVKYLCGRIFLFETHIFVYIHNVKSVMS